MKVSKKMHLVYFGHGSMKINTMVTEHLLKTNYWDIFVLDK